jgi:biotin carboxyl carrier protein
VTASEGPDSGDAVEVRRIRPGLFSVLIGHRSYEVALDLEVGEEVVGTAFVDGRAVAVQVDDPRRQALAKVASGAASAGAGAILTVVAPMPGRIVALPAGVGVDVARGDAVVVLEAMKMESSIAAPHAGTVTEWLVAVGEAVKQRQPLVRLRSS